MKTFILKLIEQRLCIELDLDQVKSKNEGAQIISKAKTLARELKQTFNLLKQLPQLENVWLNRFRKKF